MIHLRSFLCSVLFLFAVAAVPARAQVFCLGSCPSSTPGIASMFSPALLSVSSPFGAIHNAFATRFNGGPLAVAGICARSFGVEASPYAFPFDPAAGLVLVDASASLLIDLSAMADVFPAAPTPGISFSTLPLSVPNDPALVGLSIHSQAFLLMTTGAWSASNASTCVLIP